MRYGIKKKSIMCGILCGMLFMSGCGSVYEESKEGYTNVTSIEGVSFDMPERFLSLSMTLSDIAKDGDYAEGTYLYKDESMYLLFNIDEVVVAVEKGTTFDFENSQDMETTLQSDAVDGVWMEKTKDKLSYQTSKRDGEYKILADVIGNVSITPELYGKYTGYFASVQSSGYECSMFVGVKLSEDGEMTAQQEKTLKHIIKSFRLNDGMTISGTEGNTF